MERVINEKAVWRECVAEPVDAQPQEPCQWGTRGEGFEIRLQDLAQQGTTKRLAESVCSIFNLHAHPAPLEIEA